jgi:outer membrane lipoprotein LolB
MTRRAVCALLATTVLSACAGLPTGTDGRDLQQRREALASVASWDMRGRLVVDTGDGAYQGRFNWRQDDDSLELVVRSLLGAGMLQVAGRADALTVTARGETRTLTNPEVELSELVGWWLPIASLPHWLLGFPDPAYRSATEAGADGTLAALDQRMWRVAYPTYQLGTIGGSASSVLVPRRIDLTHGELTLQLTIDDWENTSDRDAP